MNLKYCTVEVTLNNSQTQATVTITGHYTNGLVNRDYVGARTIAIAGDYDAAVTAIMSDLSDAANPP